MREFGGQFRPKPLCYAVSLAIASLMAGGPALAQTGTTDTTAPQSNTAQQDSATQGKDMIQQVVVHATRRSQQSSIERKKNAATAMDSIVAEDVGSLPDRNIGEAISRISGIALDRGNFGEGISVAVRGNSADLTRVEIDGQAVQSAGGTDMAGGGSGRGTEFRQLSADLIKSVDVVKGSTADMTEGSLGGGVVIHTRTGLDFKKPFASLRVAGSQSSLNKDWTPDTNLILADKFLDGRLGLILNASTSRLKNESHSQQVATSSTYGYSRLIDFDNSPDKTFSYNPNTLNMGDPATVSPTWSYPTTAGGTFNGATPLDIVTKSAAAKTKAGCYTAFPQWSTSSPDIASLSSSNKSSAITQRGRELISCLNQWNDYTPSLIRNVVKQEDDKRQNIDLRADFKVNNELTVFAKGSYDRRKVESRSNYLYMGDISQNPSGSFTDSSTGVRSATPNSGYYLFPNNVNTRSGGLATGTVANIVPSSVVVDANHHVTQYTITNASLETDQIHATIDTTAQYLQTGGTFKHDGWTADFFVADARSSFERGDRRSSPIYTYGTAALTALPSGLWTYTFPAGFDQANPANYVVLSPPAASAAVKQDATHANAIPAYSATQQPLLTQTINSSWAPQIRETEERTAKLDLSYAIPDGVPFFKRFKTGFNLRDTFVNAWSGNGSTLQAAQGTAGTTGYVPPVYIPNPGVKSLYVGCQDTAGSLAAGGNHCNYGFNQSNDPRYPREGTVVLTPQQMQDVLTAAMKNNVTSTSFFGGANGKPDGLLSNWKAINVDTVLNMLGTPNVNFDCVKQCVGTDGQVHEQPVSKLKERSEAGYLMADFGIDHIPFTDRALPFGWELEGNMGYRYIRTRVSGTGNMTFTSITRTASFDPNNPNAAGGTMTSSVSLNTAVNATTTDFLPIYNLAMWLVPDQVVVRYNRARTVARPPVDRMLPSGTCTYDERLAQDAEQLCSKTVGNPKLLAQKNLNQNLSAEYYPNKDTMFSLAYFTQKGLVGPNVVKGMNGALFPNSNVKDPATGASLSDMNFSFPTYVNGAAVDRSGWEFGTKTAFTFLPGILRYTGFDANYTKLASATSADNVVDLISGDLLPPANQSDRSYNWALWYDDGRLSARVAVQGVSSYFTCIAACTTTNVSNPPNTNTVTGGIPYNPGFPNFRDSTRYIDAKISYKLKPNVELFIEGRNLGNATMSNSQGQYGHFASGTPSILDYNYSGRRIMVGVNFRTM